MKTADSIDQNISIFKDDGHIDIRCLFTKLGFKEDDLIESNFIFKNAFDKNSRSLFEMLKKGVYLYDKPKQAGTVFYLLSVHERLSSEEIRVIHRRIWNESKADLFIIIKNRHLVIYYAKTDPCHNPIEITRISVDQKEEKLLENISKAHFDSGAFWLIYQDALKNIEKNKKTVDVKLIDSLDILRGKLEEQYENINTDINKKRETVQALIDRTLFIKFLEDKKIINSYFYKHYFENHELNYKGLLCKKDAKEINKLFTNINSICNNSLFEKPVIDKKYLTDEVLSLLYHTISQTDLKSDQMNLFDFQFDIIPVESISRIYEAFLEDKQKKYAAYYTPEGLADLILNSVIIKEDYGSILDPSCGSGVFLVLAFRKMLKNAKIENFDIKELIRERNEFLESNIFGIEKDPIARRLTIFSLYLEMFNGIEPEKIKALIKENITDEDFKLFPKHFDKNILCADTLETDQAKEPFKSSQFDFIVGNPPWKIIDEEDDEYRYWINNQQYLGGKKQLSQCFLVKIKHWAKEKCRYGFVVNSSNFDKENKKFHNFFYNAYDIEKIYELTGIKDILFESAKEPAITLIFTNEKNENNIIEYISPDLTDFAKKFKIILLQEKDIIPIPQLDLIDGRVKLRDYLIGNRGDIDLVKKIQENNSNTLEELLTEYKGKTFIQEGLIFFGVDATHKYLNKNNKEWKELSQEKRNSLKESVREEFYKTYRNKKKTDTHCIKYLEPNDLSNFVIQSYSGYMTKDRSKFSRGRDNELFVGDKILVNRIGNEIKAVYVKEKVYFSSDIYVIKLNDKGLYPFVTAILNSKLIDYMLSIRKRKRPKAAYAKLNEEAFKSIPMPDISDFKTVVSKINKLSDDILNGRVSYEEKKDELDDLVFKLYDLDILERSRIIDFFEQGEVAEKDIVNYSKTFNMVFRPYLKKGSILEFEYEDKKTLPIDFAGVKISFVKKENSNIDTLIKSPSISKVEKFLIMDMLKNVGTTNVLTLKDRIYGNNCIYIIKDKNKKSWTTTKAVEDARAEIKRICV